MDSHVTTSLDIPTPITVVDTLISFTGTTPADSQIMDPQDRIGGSNETEILYYFNLNILQRSTFFASQVQK